MCQAESVVAKGLLAFYVETLQEDERKKILATGKARRKSGQREKRVGLERLGKGQGRMEVT